MLRKNVKLLITQLALALSACSCADLILAHEVIVGRSHSIVTHVPGLRDESWMVRYEQMLNGSWGRSVMVLPTGGGEVLVAGDLSVDIGGFSATMTYLENTGVWPVLEPRLIAWAWGATERAADVAVGIDVGIAFVYRYRFIMRLCYEKFCLQNVVGSDDVSFEGWTLGVGWSH